MKKIMIFVLLCSFIFVSCPSNYEVSVTQYGTPNKDYIDESLSYVEGGGVMLQAFSWESCNSLTQYNKSWWTFISENSKEIKDNFEYVWFPPCVDSLSFNGYLPKELNKFNTKYGTESELVKALADVKPCKAIADVVINHRVGTISWGDFTNPSWGTVKGVNYKVICSTDEGFKNEPSLMGKVSTSMRGAEDTGDNYSSGRDLDHTNKVVQDGIIEWMNLLKSKGFEGFRYDYVRGFDGKYVGYYNKMTEPVFSVGELWPDNYSASLWSQKIDNWIQSTTETVNDVVGQKSCAFDFVLKGVFNSVFGSSKNSYSSVANKNYGQLANEYILINKNPEYAVTFVDNHDTGSTQNYWPIDSVDIGTAYVYILTHPGVLCVAWQHYFSNGTTDSDGNVVVPGTTQSMHNHINYLINLRNKVKINKTSNVEVINKESSLYCAKIYSYDNSSSLIVSIGTKQIEVPDGYVPVYSGTNWIIYIQE